MCSAWGLSRAKASKRLEGDDVNLARAGFPSANPSFLPSQGIFLDIAGCQKSLVEDGHVSWRSRAQ